MNMEISELIKNYMGEYEKEEHPFLLFDLAHVNENDHTRVLMSILKYNIQFLASFLQMIGAPDFKSMKMPPTDQKKAIGKKGNGFIDLYFEYTSNEDSVEKVIIENKINEAGDTDYQLARYIASAVDDSICNDDFLNKIWPQWEKGEIADGLDESYFSHIHVIYLTSDGSKKPEGKSLPKYFRKNADDEGNFEGNHIQYYPINYLNDIIPWLEDKVLPQMPYSDDGIAIAGIRQYIASLNAMFSTKGNSTAIDDFVKELQGTTTDKGKYDEIMKAKDYIKSLPEKTKDKKELKEKGIDIDNLNLQSLIRDLRAAAINIFAKDGSEMGEDWKFYFTPSFIIIYRQRWADLDTRKYSIPSIFLLASTYKILSPKRFNWNIQIDHLDYRKAKNNCKSPFSLCNRNKTAYFVIPDGGSSVNFNKFDFSSRKAYYKDLPSKLGDYIELVDAVVEEVKNSPSKSPIFQEDVLKKLAEKLQKNSQYIDESPSATVRPTLADGDDY